MIGVEGDELGGAAMIALTKSGSIHGKTAPFIPDPFLTKMFAL